MIKRVKQADRSLPPPFTASEKTWKCKRASNATYVLKSHLQTVSLRADTRMAMLASKRKIDANSKSNRDELFSSPAMMEKQTSEKSTYVSVLHPPFQSLTP